MQLSNAFWTLSTSNTLGKRRKVEYERPKFLYLSKLSGGSLNQNRNSQTQPKIKLSFNQLEALENYFYEVSNIQGICHRNSFFNHFYPDFIPGNNQKV
jgi:hypothetical protein